MRHRIRNGWAAVAVSAMALWGPGAVGVGHADEAREIEGLKRQIEELRRSDAEKTRQLDELKKMVELLVAREPATPAPGAPASAPAAVAAPRTSPPAATSVAGESALDRAIREAEAAAGTRPSTAAAPPSAPAAGALATTTTTGPAALDDQLRDLARQGTPVVTGAASERAARGLGLTEQPSLFARRVGQATVRLIDISMDILSVSGWSTADDREISDLQYGAHDPKRRGFTLQQAELSLSGAVDPYFTGELHVVATTGGLELEEAFLTTTRLPTNLQIEAGYFFTEFGRINPLHPHAWDWIDQPVIVGRLMGSEGLRGVGTRAAWLLPTPWFTEMHLGVQNANESDYTVSFLNGEEAIGGRPAVKQRTSNPSDLLYLTRLNSSYDFTDALTGIVGFSGLFGPNSSGDDARTFVYGLDMTWKWQPANSQRGWPFLTWQTELMKRDYTADHFLAGTAAGSDGGHGHSHGTEEPEEDEDEFTEDIPGALLRDWGLYTQLLWGFQWQWAAGLRYEYADGSGASLPDGRSADFLRNDRHRVSPLLIWQPSEFSRFRLQYNFDHTQGAPVDEAHSVWFSMEILYGAHPAHNY